MKEIPGIKFSGDAIELRGSNSDVLLRITSEEIAQIVQGLQVASWRTNTLNHQVLVMTPNAKYPTAKKLSMKGILNLLQPNQLILFKRFSSGLFHDGEFGISIDTSRRGVQTLNLGQPLGGPFSPRDAILLKTWFWELSNPKNSDWETLVNEKRISSFFDNAPKVVRTWRAGSRYFHHWYERFMRA